MSYQLIALDLDGTLLNSRKEIPAEAAEAIRAVTAAGKTVVFATSRAVCELDEQIALLIGVHPDYQSKGVISLIINHMMKAYRRLGIRSCRCCPMLEENSKVLSLMNVGPSKPCRRRRSFIKHL